jgi:hypothetical protein
MQITMAGTFFMMRFWTHLMLFFQANHHGTKVFAKLVRLVNLQQITMAGTFFMMRFWTHLMLFFQANHHGTKVFVKPFFSESTANHHGRSVFHI